MFRIGSPGKPPGKILFRAWWAAEDSVRHPAFPAGLRRSTEKNGSGRGWTAVSETTGPIASVLEALVYSGWVL
jgi:hypothetical protein